MRPLLAAMRQALPFPFNSDLAGDSFERLVAVSLCCRIRLLFQKIALPRVPPYTVVASIPQAECAASCRCSPHLLRESVLHAELSLQSPQLIPRKAFLVSRKVGSICAVLHLCCAICNAREGHSRHSQLALVPCLQILGWGDLIRASQDTKMQGSLCVVR